MALPVDKYLVNATLGTPWEVCCLRQRQVQLFRRVDLERHNIKYMNEDVKRF